MSVFVAVCCRRKLLWEKCWPIRQKAVENRASANQAEGHAQPFWADKSSRQQSTPSLWLVAFAPRRCPALRDTLTWDPVS
ncbi:hypothetical protein LEMLEM_LOCUS24096 [Lemmus lemmus]